MTTTLRYVSGTLWRVTHNWGWRVVRGVIPVEVHSGKNGAYIRFKSRRAAQLRADKLNAI